MKFPNLKAQAGLSAIAISTLVFLIILVVYGEVENALNMDVFSASVQDLIDLIPLVLVGSALVFIVVAALRFAQ
jgi:hypothetical protein